MNFSITPAVVNDINDILVIVEDARELITSIGFKQWSKEEGYPGYNDFLNDINNNNLYVVKDANKIIAMFACIIGNDPSYDIIDGKWLTNTSTYVTIHRVAIKKEYYGQGISKLILDFAKEIGKKNNITSMRADTHSKNIPMNKTLLKYGFTYCGIIKILDCNIEPERNAYEILI